MLSRVGQWHAPRTPTHNIARSVLKLCAYWHIRRRLPKEQSHARCAGRGLGWPVKHAKAGVCFGQRPGVGPVGAQCCWVARFWGVLCSGATPWRRHSVLGCNAPQSSIQHAHHFGAGGLNLCGASRPFGVTPGVIFGTPFPPFGRLTRPAGWWSLRVWQGRGMPRASHMWDTCTITNRADGIWLSTIVCPPYSRTFSGCPPRSRTCGGWWSGPSGMMAALARCAPCMVPLQGSGEGVGGSNHPSEGQVGTGGGCLRAGCPGGALGHGLVRLAVCAPCIGEGEGSLACISANPIPVSAFVVLFCIQTQGQSL